MTSEMVALEDAVGVAIEQGRVELSRLDQVVDDLVGSFAQVGTSAQPESQLVARLDDVARGLPRDLRRHLDRERDSLGSFNIAFFGRTGAGKSTLLSAFGQLDGEYVSPGASDWTTDVHHVEWRGCRLYDTPGINGWGRTESRQDLEAKARRAVEIADVVLLCFDNQSQQALEFEKIAAWIRDHGKPVVAVLNVKNPRWRHPAKVPEGRRKQLSESVRQHTDNIRTELAQIGLPETPVVAIHSRRALLARAATPFHGPARNEFHRERDEFGVDYLARWSNFGPLEQLITASIVVGGADLRLAALREDVRGRCTRTVNELERLAAEIEREAEVTERHVESLFAVLGYPEGEERRSLLYEADRDLVAISEAARGRPYTSKPVGSLGRYVRDISSSHFAKCRSTAKSAADQLIQSAFDNNKSVDQAEFAEAVFDEDAIATAEQTIWADRSEFLRRELQIAVEQDGALRPGSTGHAATILGSEGTGVLGKVIQGGGIAAGLGVLAVPALMNFWNPAGWAIGVAIAGVGIAGQVQQFFGKRMSDQEDERARKARAQAIADSYHAVERTFDDREELIDNTSRAYGWQLLAEAIRESLSLAIELRDSYRRAELLIGALRGGGLAVERSPRVSDVLRRAQDRIADSPTSLTKTLLGEDWLTNSGVDHSPVEVDPAIEVMYGAQHDYNKSRLQRAFAEAWSTPEADGIRSWREDLEDAAMRDPSLLEAAQQFSRISKMKPTLTVLGDYNSGKSSLIRRILAESYRRSDAPLDIRAVPATDTAQKHEFARFDLVDTPGLQSGQSGHDARALEAVVQAALVIVVVHINLLVGDTRVLEQIARGSSTLAAKGERMVFIVNRCDELGLDPIAAADAFANLQDRKRDELRAAFSGRSIEIHPDRVHCLSGDPFGLVGNAEVVDQRDFADNRLWDGVAALTEVMKEMPDSLLSSASATAAFDAAITELKRHRAGLEQVNDVAAAELRTVEPIIATLQIALDDAKVLGASLREEARRIVDGHASAAKSRLHEFDRNDTKQFEELVESWYKEPYFAESLDRFLRDSAKRLEIWHSEHASAIDREHRAANFELSHEIDEGFEVRHDPLYEDVAEGAGKVVGASAPLVKALGNRDAVYAIGKQLGHKFKPWGAVKGGAKVAKAGAVLAVVGAAVDAAVMVNDARKAGEYAEYQAGAARAVDSQAVVLVEMIVQGENGAGPLGYLNQTSGELESLLADHTSHASAQRQIMDDGAAKVEAVGSLLASADALLEGGAKEHDRA